MMGVGADMSIEGDFPTVLARVAGNAGLGAWCVFAFLIMEVGTMLVVEAVEVFGGGLYIENLGQVVFGEGHGFSSPSVSGASSEVLKVI